MEETFFGRFARGVLLYERLSVALLADVELWCQREQGHEALWGYDARYVPAQKTWVLRVARTDWDRGKPQDLSATFEAWLREGTLVARGEQKYSIRFPSCILSNLELRHNDYLRATFTIVHNGTDPVLSIE